MKLPKIFDKVKTTVKEKTEAVMTDAVKEKVKETAVDIAPAVVGTIVVVSGIVAIIKGRKVPDIPKGITPTVSNVHTVTNNYFFSNDIRDEVLEAIKGGMK